MSNTDAQRIIYYKVLTSLLDREFNVKVQLEDTSSIFHIRWLSDDEEKDIELQHSLLAKHTINKRKNL
jgi:peptide subunit release factor RF-3